MAATGGGGVRIKREKSADRTVDLSYFQALLEASRDEHSLTDVSLSSFMEGLSPTRAVPDAKLKTKTEPKVTKPKLSKDTWAKQEDDAATAFRLQSLVRQLEAVERKLHSRAQHTSSRRREETHEEERSENGSRSSSVSSLGSSVAHTEPPKASPR